VRLKEILDVQQAVISLSNVLLPTPQQNREVYRLLKAVMGEADNYKLQGNKILMKYGERKPTGEYFVPRGSLNFNIALQELSALENMDVDLAFKPIVIDFDGLNLNAADVYSLEKAGIIKLGESGK